ncbi:MAG: copper homeostasis periplasmic binding protein CopC [Alphaproteobacteria bacterium]|nr:copper homeostasis periplasmic binding protein CopC [Alphaproteobacteria bacterium]
MKKAIALAAALALPASAAFAHAHLIKEIPSAKSSVKVAPSHLTLDFSEGVSLAFTGVTVTGPGKAHIKLKHASLAQGNDQKLIVPFAQKLKHGSYTVAWHALSTDGHRTHGSYSFSVK